MKKKYIFTLVVIGLMLALTLTMGTGYGLWLSTKDKNELSSTTLNCFKIYYPDGSDTFEMKNINPVTAEEGLETSPYTLVITNICDIDKELQVRLNVLDESTIDLKSLTIEASGNLTQEAVLYNNLTINKSLNENVVQSRLIGIINVKPNETVRTNVKLWFDERKNPNIDKNNILKAQFELIDKESSVKAKFYETLLTEKSKIDAKTAPNLTTISTTADGLYATTTNNGKSYYYRGVVNNNYVSFGNYIWRIVRINEDGTIKLILDKSATYTEYNKLINEKDFVGYKYIWYNNEVNSNAKNALESWYDANITAKDLDKYVAESSYCNDSGYETSNFNTYFNGYNRIVTDKAPSLVCPETNADFGGTFNTKVGLITADEVVLAGGSYDTTNMNYYLYNGENFFTMTPYEFTSYKAYIYSVNNTGSLTSSLVNEQLGLRPVITLISDITVSGAGTIDNPYTIDMQ